jgi:hypothetical protein
MLPSLSSFHTTRVSPGVQLVQDAVQLRTDGQRASGAAGRVGEGAVAAGRDERVDLEVEVLLGSADASIAKRRPRSGTMRSVG